MTDGPHYDGGSYRDRSARVFHHAGEVYRALSEQALDEWSALSATRFFGEFVAAGKLVQTDRWTAAAPPPAADPPPAAILRHETIPFVSYPYEWSFGMLKAAALLQLDLLLAALSERMILKDATPYNVQWKGPSPVFIDIASLERLRPGEPWAGYRQFCELCLYPLLIQAYKGLSFRALLRGNLDGIDAAQCAGLFSAMDALRPGVLKHVMLQSKLQSAYAGKSRDVKTELRRAGFNKELIVANVKNLRKLVGGLDWRAPTSGWVTYEQCNTYDEADATAKAAFVEAAAAGTREALVWDIGCNTGRFARIAARHARYVVAMDADEGAVDRLFVALRQEGVKNILPLVNNVADPSPDLGWRNSERKRLDDRGRPGLVLCLALVHHLSIGANLPLDEVVRWLANLAREVVIEFVHRDDPMVVHLLRNKADKHSDYDLAHFERCLAGAFTVLRTQPLSSGTRTLYHLRAERQ